MICVIAGNKLEAERYASSQNWEDTEWFYPASPEELRSRENFHVIVIGTAGMNVPPAYFERVYQLALSRGKMNRNGK